MSRHPPLEGSASPMGYGQMGMPPEKEMTDGDNELWFGACGRVLGGGHGVHGYTAFGPQGVLGPGGGGGWWEATPHQGTRRRLVRWGDHVMGVSVGRCAGPRTDCALPCAAAGPSTGPHTVRRWHAFLRVHSTAQTMCCEGPEVRAARSLHRRCPV